MKEKQKQKKRTFRLPPSYFILNKTKSFAGCNCYEECKSVSQPLFKDALLDCRNIKHNHD